MQTLSELINIIAPDKANITIDSSIYDLQAINAASYAFNDDYYIVASPKEGTLVTVIFELKNNSSNRDIAIDIKEFLNTVIDHQVRLQLDRANGKIRDLIVSHAFSPLDLNKEVESL